jgi:ribose transport system permease protein
MGIDRKKTVIIGALIGAAFIGMGAVIQISYAGRVYATTGLGSLASIFQALACVLLSGSIASILSPPVGILVSSFFVVSIFNVLTMLGVPSGTGQDIFLGVIVVVCGILSHLRHKGVVK